MLPSGLVYKYKYGGCNATYMVRPNIILKSKLVNEHSGISHLSGKKVKIDNNKLKATQEHLLRCNYPSSFEDFSILIRESNNFKLNGLLIAHDKSVPNKVNFSLCSSMMFYNII